jgi:hypothetical protein
MFHFGYPYIADDQKISPAVRKIRRSIMTPVKTSAKRARSEISDTIEGWVVRIDIESNRCRRNICQLASNERTPMGRPNNFQKRATSQVEINTATQIIPTSCPAPMRNKPPEMTSTHRRLRISGAMKARNSWSSMGLAFYEEANVKC